KTAVGELHIPTFADAGVYAYFNCAAPTDTFGWTKPWITGNCIQKGLDDREVRPRPEGVHLPVTLGDLQRPLEMIQP
ncbi:MAG TPA: hypothetical protein VN824_22370, partial [Puia sp.]|nr:hypothetical protein [Puia sp.]